MTKYNTYIVKRDFRSNSKSSNFYGPRPRPRAESGFCKFDTDLSFLQKYDLRRTRFAHGALNSKLSASFLRMYVRPRRRLISVLQIYDHRRQSVPDD